MGSSLIISTRYKQPPAPPHRNRKVTVVNNDHPKVLFSKKMDLCFHSVMCLCYVRFVSVGYNGRDAFIYHTVRFQRRFTCTEERNIYFAYSVLCVVTELEIMDSHFRPAYLISSSAPRPGMVPGEI